jgi:hypothetical protein
VATAPNSTLQTASVVDPQTTTTSSSGLNQLFNHPDFNQTATTLGETGSSQAGSTGQISNANDAVASVNAKRFALFNQVMAESFGQDPNVGQIATASTGSSQHQSVQFLAKARG